MDKPTHLSLFTGIGGLDLASEWAGFETVGQCEFADYPTKVLEKHWPDVPRWRDIRTLTKESFYERTGRTTVDVISGGFPCQPFSTAGKRRGKEDDRYLWPEMLRVISEIEPAWVIGENVAGIISMALDDILADLENIGYSAQSFNIPACAVGAPHRRKRVFIVANSAQTNGYDGNAQKRGDDNNEAPLEYRGRAWWDSEPELCRVVDGIPSKLDISRDECLGNAVVPQQAYPLFKAIFEEVMRLRQNEECSQKRS